MRNLKLYYLIGILLTFLNVNFATAINPTEGSNKSKKMEILDSRITRLYNSIEFPNSKPSYNAFKHGIIGYLNLKEKGDVKKDIISLIDFSLSSKKNRLWIIDLKNKEVIYETYVAHGRNSGNEYATKFSNVPNSNTSSLGFYTTAETYVGNHGLSLRLDGKEYGINHNARKRAIVLHGAKYVCEDFIERTGRLGRSFGCPSVKQEISQEIINLIANRSVMFIYYPDKEYFSKTKLLNIDIAFKALINQPGLI